MSVNLPETVIYYTVPKRIDLSKADMTVVQLGHSVGHRVPVIKYIRHVHNVGLLEAKCIVDAAFELLDNNPAKR